LDCFVVTCEHGGNGVPADCRSFFVDHGALLETHRGFDPGALLFAQELSSAFGAPLVASTTSRLLVDLNRSIGHRHLFFDATASAPPELRTEIVAKHYRPYRSLVESVVAKAVGDGQRVVHVSSHSFTPVMDGETRNADVGLLYDPARLAERELCARWKSALSSISPGLRVRSNYPYLGKGDGFTSHLRKRYGPLQYVGIELEINQQTVFGPSQEWIGLRANLIESFRTATGV
jgi:predicted N-formylglutamate amidohydrolase